MRKSSDKPFEYELQSIDIRSVIRDSFKELETKTKEALKGFRDSVSIDFYASKVSQSELSFEVSLQHNLNTQKSAKPLPAASPLVEGDIQHQSVHWLIVSQEQAEPIVSVTRSETIRKLGEMKGMGKGTRTTAIFLHEEKNHIWTPDELTSNFKSAIALIAPAKIRDKLITAQIIEPEMKNTYQ